MACNPAKFNDLGKDASDLLSKNFHFGNIKFVGKTKSKSGAEFKLDGGHNTETGSVNASLETKLGNFKGISMTEKWNTSNAISTDFSCGSLMKGLKVDLETEFHPSTGKKAAKVKTAFNNEWVHSTHDMELDFAGPTLFGSFVSGYKGFLVGVGTSFETANSKLGSTHLKGAYNSGGDFKITAGIKDFNQYSGSIYHQVNDNLAASAELNWNSDGAAPSITAGVKQSRDADTFIKIKIDNNLRLGYSYVTNLATGIQVTLSALVNTKDFNGGGHKVGLSLDMSA